MSQTCSKIIQGIDPNFKPTVAIILGSGLGEFSEHIKNNSHAYIIESGLIAQEIPQKIKNELELLSWNNGETAIGSGFKFPRVISTSTSE